jgi:hypothetical protein
MALQHDALDIPLSSALKSVLEFLAAVFVVGLRKHFIASHMEMQVANLIMSLMSNCMVWMMIAS